MSVSLTNTGVMLGCKTYKPWFSIRMTSCQFLSAVLLKNEIVAISQQILIDTQVN